MRSLRLIRTRVLCPLLAAAFVAASFGLPAADILLDHRLEGPHQSVQAHLEDLNGCREHIDHCALARMLGAVRLQAASASPPEFLPAADTARTELLRPGVPFAPHQPFYFSRAPPQAA